MTRSSQLDDLESSYPRYAWMRVVAVILLGVSLRAWNLQEVGYNSDEITEIVLAREPLADIFLDRDDDRFPPLHRTTMALWNRAWQSEEATRWLSVVYGFAAMIVIWRAGAELVGELGAIWPTLILACSPFDVYYSRDGRAYEMYTLFSAVIFWAALRLLRRGSWANWALLIVGTALAVFTHYYAAPLSVVIWLIVLPVAAKRDGWGRATAAASIVALVLLSAGLLLWWAMSDLPDEKLVAWFDVEALGYTYVALATGYTVGPSMQELRSMPAIVGIRQFLPVVIALGFAYAALGWQAVRRLNTGSLVLLLAPPVVLVPALGVLGNLTGIGLVQRYVCWIIVPYALVLGAGATRWRQSWAASGGVALLLAVNFLGIYNRFFEPRYAEEDYRAIAAKLDELDPERDQPVLVASDYMGEALKYYVGEARRQSSFPIFPQHGKDREARIAEFLQTQPHGTRIWMVSQWLPADDVRRATRDAALKQFQAELVAEMNQTEIYSATVP